MNNDKTNLIVKYVVPSLQDILFIASFYLILILGTNLIRDGDPGRHITIGKYMIENRRILTMDLFSYTIQHQPIALHEWFSELLYGASYLLMGLNGVVILAALVLSMTFVLIYRELLDRDTPRLLAFGLTIWAISITMLHWLARPHLFSWLFLALYTYQLGKLYRGKKASLWFMAGIMLVWANSHGGFIYGFAVWAAYFIGWVIENRKTSGLWSSPVFKKLFAAGGLSFLVTLINPFGLGLWQISVGYATNKYFADRISEWRSVDFHSLGAWPFLALVCISLLLSLRSIKKQPLGESFLMAGFTALGIYSVRNIPPYAVVVVPLAGNYFTPYFKKITKLIQSSRKIEALEQSAHGILWLWPALVVIVCTIMLANGIKLDAAQMGYHFNSQEFPVAAVNWLEENPLPGHMFNSFRWGGYLIYRLWPHELVFMDGQTEFYGEKLTRQHDQILDAQDGWETVVDQYQIKWMIVPVESRIALLLTDSTTWKTVYKDGTAVILQKQP